MIYYAAAHYPAFLDVLRLPTLHFTVFYSKLFTCPFHSLHFSFGFQRLPCRLSWPIGLLGPSFHSLPSYAFTRYQAMIYYAAVHYPAFLHVLRLPYISWYFTASFSPAPSIAYIFHLGFNVYLPGILGILICLVLAFTRYQAMIYYAAVHYPAFLDVLRLPHISWYFTASFSPAPSIAYIFHLGFNVYLPGILGLLICLVLAFTRYQATIYYAALPSDLRFFSITLHFMVFYSKLFTCPFHSLHFSFGFQRLPSRHSWPIDLLGPSFHSLPSYDLLRSYALPSVFRCFEITLHFMVLYTKLFTCPFNSLLFHAGLNFWDLLRSRLSPSFHSLPSYDLLPNIFRLPWHFVAMLFNFSFITCMVLLGFDFYCYVPGILGLLSCLVLAFTRYQAMIYYAASRALPSVLRLLCISWCFTACFSPAPLIAYIFHLGFHFYVPGILGLLHGLVLACPSFHSRLSYEATLYYPAVLYPAF